MELLPVTADYDTLSDKTRLFAAQRLAELIETLRPVVAEALDGTSLYDLEPARIQANVALVKLNANLIKQLGELYRVQDRPREELEASMPLEQVQKLLDAAEARTEEAVAAALEEGQRRGLELGAARERVSLEAARAAVASGLRALQQ